MLHDSKLLDKETDIDVPDCFVSLADYSATLGHKACHTFGARKNAKFANLYHPRHVVCIM